MVALVGFIVDLFVDEFNNPIHPVCLVGKLALKVEKHLFHMKTKYFAGLLTWVITFFVSMFCLYAIIKLCLNISFYLKTIVEILLFYFLICTKGLIQESNKVLNAFDDLNKAKLVLSRIVGRNTEKLDNQGVLRALIETLSENLSDGVIAPLFYYMLFGIYGMFAYKIINTLDSMFGYKNERYYKFGFVSAKIDDLANFIPARLSAYLLLISSLILKLDFKNAFIIYKRDCYNHLSINSAHPESVVAGALNIQLGGPSFYFNKLVIKQTIGDNINKLDISMLKKVHQLIYISSIIMLSLILVKEVVFHEV